jgi:hypothetical protein
VAHMKQLNTQVFALVLGVQVAFAAAAVAQTPTDDEALAATLSSAWSAAQAERPAATATLTPEQRQADDTAFAALSTTSSTDATLAGVDASAVTDRSVAVDAVARVDTATTYEQLRAAGKANEQAAYKRKREAGRYDPPLKDDKGYYFDVVQTWNYKHVPRTDDVGLQPPEYYAAMRCRAAPRKVGPLADNPNWKKSVFWRVCPDETGRYRPAM